MKRLVLTAIASLLAAPAFAADACPKMTATVNGVAIPASRMEMLIKETTSRGQQLNPQMCDSLLDNLVKTEVLVQEALKQGLDKKAEVQMEMEMTRQAVLFRNLLKGYVAANGVNEEKLKAEYEKLKPQIAQNEVQARHILVKTEKEALEVLAALKKGKKFEELAKAKSQDPGSKDNGGDLGWANPNNYVKPFAEAALALQKGEITKTPVKTDYGYHIIQLMDKRSNTPPLDQIRQQLQEKMQRELVENYVNELRSKATVQ